MQKLILVSILVASVLVPLWAAKEPNARRGLKKALFAMLVVEMVYLAAVLIIYPRL
jgi:hypothetical protein